MSAPVPDNASKRQDGWRPIETAPKDGSAILIFQPKGGRDYYMPSDALRPGEISYKSDDPRMKLFDDGRYSIGYWRPWGGWGNRNSAKVEATHWMPLPAEPPR